MNVDLFVFRWSLLVLNQDIILCSSFVISWIILSTFESLNGSVVSSA